MSAAPPIETQRDHYLLSVSPGTLYDMLPDNTQSNLWIAFVAECIDGADVEEIMELVRDHKYPRLNDWSLRISQRWDDFLGRRDLLNQYRHRLESEYDERYADSPPVTSPELQVDPMDIANDGLRFRGSSLSPVAEKEKEL